MYVFGSRGNGLARHVSEHWLTIANHRMSDSRDIVVSADAENAGTAQKG